MTTIKKRSVLSSLASSSHLLLRKLLFSSIYGYFSNSTYVHPLIYMRNLLWDYWVDGKFVALRKQQSILATRLNERIESIIQKQCTTHSLYNATITITSYAPEGNWWLWCDPSWSAVESLTWSQKLLPYHLQIQ